MENPLTKRDLTDIKEALYKIASIYPLLDLLDKLGQDTTEIRAKVDFYKSVLTTLRTELFPETP